MILKVKFEKNVWILLSSNFFFNLTSFICLPFMALYLSRQNNLDPSTIGIILGSGPFAFAFSGFLSGHWSDRVGPKRILLLSVLLRSLVFVGLARAHTAIEFALWNVLVGITTAAFRPVIRSYVLDHVPKEKRTKALSYLYLGTNIAAALGPGVGALLLSLSSTLIFNLNAVLNLTFAIYLLLSLKINKNISSDKIVNSNHKFKDSVMLIWKERALFFLILTAGVISIVYSQIDSTLPQHLNKLIPSTKEVDRIYSSLLIINALAVIALQHFIVKFIEKISFRRAFFAATLGFASGYIGFALVGASPLGLMVAMFIFTVGEMFEFITVNQALDEFVRSDKRGTAFGALSFRELGRFVGPWLGGIGLQYWGGAPVMVVAALLSLSSLGVFMLALTAHKNS